MEEDFITLLKGIKKDYALNLCLSNNPAYRELFQCYDIVTIFITWKNEKHQNVNSRTIVKGITIYELLSYKAWLCTYVKRTRKTIYIYVCWVNWIPTTIAWMCCYLRVAYFYLAKKWPKFSLENMVTGESCGHEIWKCLAIIHWAVTQF